MAAAVALLDMAAQRRGPTQLDRTHGAALGYRERSAALLTVGFAVAAEYVRHFRRPGHHCPGAQKRSGGAGFGVTVSSGCGSKSSGLDVEQTLLVAIRR